MVPDHDGVDTFLEECPIYGKGYWFTVAMRQEEYVYSKRRACSGHKKERNSKYCRTAMNRSRTHSRHSAILNKPVKVNSPGSE